VATLPQRTLSRDTTPDAEVVQLDIFRKMSPRRKLQWFKEGGEVSDRQWNDVLGILRVQGDRLDAAYLDTWAVDLGVEELLAKARKASS